MRRSTRLSMGGAVSGLVAVAVGGWVAAASGPSAVDPPPRVAVTAEGPTLAGGQRINDPTATAPAYARNAAGLTYGSLADSPRPDLEPDLAWVVTDDGGSGYVYSRELSPPPPDPATPASPVLALRAYASDGVTVVGTFTIGGR